MLKVTCLLLISYSFLISLVFVIISYVIFNIVYFVHIL